MPRKPNTTTVAFRIPVTALEELERQAASMGVKRSVLLRSLILTGLGEKPRMAAIQEAFFTIKPLMFRVVSYATDAIYKAMPELIDKELRSEEGEEPEPGDVEPEQNEPEAEPVAGADW